MAATAATAEAMVATAEAMVATVVTEATGEQYLILVHSVNYHSWDFFGSIKVTEV